MATTESRPLKARFYANEDIQRVLVAIPKGHKHIRMLIECTEGSRIVFQEATLAAMTRAYLSILLHPNRRAIELCIQKGHVKNEYAEWQLVETSAQEQDVINELSSVETL